MKNLALVLIIFINAIVSLIGQNVGIGTTNPNGELHIHDTTNDGGVSQKLTTSKAELVFGFNSTSEGFLGTSSAHDMRFRTKGITRLVIDKTGQIGIGTTLPSEKMQLNDGSFFLSGLGTANSEGMLFGETSAPTYGWIYDGLDNQMHMREFIGTSSDIISISSDGSVGFGTDNPTEKMQLNDGSFFLSDLGSTNTKGFLLGEASTPIYGWLYDGIGSNSDNKLVLREYLGTESNLIEVNGNGETKITNLASSGSKPLYAEADGTLSTGPAFSFISGVRTEPNIDYTHNIHIPDGARIISIEIRYRDDTSSDEIKFELRKTPFTNASGGSPLVEFSSGISFSSSALQSQLLTIPLSEPLVDNNQFVYFVRATYDNGLFGNDLSIGTYRIKYTFD